MNGSIPSFKANLEALLAPISFEQPAGESLRYDPVYDQIKEARREDDPALPQGIYVTELKRANWPLVETLCSEALQQRSKDLQLGVWLMEAWMQVHDFAGAREGLYLLYGLCEGYWEILYPEIEGDDYDFRLAPLEWMDRHLSLALKQRPITSPKVGDLRSFTYADYESASRREMVPQKQKKDDAEDELPTHAQFLTSVTMTPTGFFEDLYQMMAETLAGLDALEDLLAPWCGAQAPRFYQMREVIGLIQRHAGQVLDEQQTAEGHGATLLAPGGDGGHVRQGAYVIQSRAEAYRMLMEAAEYLAKIEPHSPTPYLVRRAVSWGSMSLVELLNEFVKDRNDLAFIHELLGLHEG